MHPVMVAGHTATPRSRRGLACLVDMPGLIACTLMRRQLCYVTPSPMQHAQLRPAPMGAPLRAVAAALLSA
jgi:hypothetical protein